MKKTFSDCYLGLDIGTDSIGWAVTDKNYNLEKLNGKAMWGIRLFEAGKTAEERRLHRSARRRQQRRVQRIKLLQELFATEICNVDPAFYQRLKDSKFYVEDKEFAQKNALFNDTNFNDKDYHKSYPTIYHLRKALIEEDREFDARLVYLALHHIIKNRGHFLFEGQTIASISSFSNVYENLKLYLKDELDIELDCQATVEVEQIIKSRNIGIQKKRKRLEELFYAETKQEKAIIGLIAGAVVKLSDLFDDKSFDDNEITKISFDNSKYDEEEPMLEDILQEKMECVRRLKSIYDWGILAEICQGKQYLSEAKTAIYDTHKEDLILLKKVIRRYALEKYSEVFRNPLITNNYCAYIGKVGKDKANKNEKIVEKTCSQEELCKYIQSILKDITNLNDEELNEILAKTENRTLLPKQITKDNGVIPYQIHRNELNLILEKASKYLKTLNQIDDTGFSVKEKIIKIFEFRIPYYVGPLNDAHKGSGNCWIVKQSDEKIRPWNFENAVDLEGSAEAFIKRMTNKCTYLIGADVLPKNSLLYSEFMVLNEINNLKINGENISVETKQNIFSELFLKRRRVTGKQLSSYLISEGIMGKQDKLTGIDVDCKASMSSFLDFRDRIGEKVNQKEMVESIISWIVLFGSDKKILEKRLKKVYGSKLSDSEIKSILGLKYSGWGRLSKEFLEDIMGTDQETGEYMSVISALRNTNDNLMQILSSKYNYLEEIKKYNDEQISDQPNEINYEAVEKLYVSPAVRRSIWQTLLIVKEIAKILQKSPKKIFVEMARSEEEKKRTKSRKDVLVDLYKTCKEETRNWVEEISSRSDTDLRSDRLYLYYTQMGRCMYTGETIKLENLFNVNIYDVDHIYPQSKIKDDSIENRVLVKKTSNTDKSDIYPLPHEVQARNKQFWQFLFEKGMIGKKKYDRLVRTNPFSDDELADFIARQLVETRQSTKAVAEILKRVLPDSEIVYVKAGNVSDFRHRYDLIKVREINDYHHAKDAYLNIVVGNVFNTKFTHSPINFIKKYEGKKYNLNRMYDFDVERDNTVAWKTGEAGTIAQIKNTMKKNNILFTRYATENKGTLSDQNILKKGKGQMPIKGNDFRFNDINKYGAYNKPAGAYFMLVENYLKGKLVRTIEYVPVHLAKELEDNNEKRISYCKDILKLEKPRILLDKIKINTLFNFEGSKLHLSGRTGNRLILKMANQLCIETQDELYIKKVLKYLERNRIARKELTLSVYDGVSKDLNNKIYELFISKLKTKAYSDRLSAQAENLENGRETFIKLTAAQQCKVLAEALHLFQCNSVLTDISLIGGPKNAGTILLSNKISNYDNIKIINQSPSGLFSKEIDLLAL